MALINKLSAIGDAIRQKTGTTALIPLNSMPQKILSIETGEGDTIPSEAFVLDGLGNYRFAYNYQNWLLNRYGDRLTGFLSSVDYLFYSSNQLREIPTFENVSIMLGEYLYNSYIFYGCTYVKHISEGFIKRLVPTRMGTTTMHSIFRECRSLQEIKGLTFNPTLTATASFMSYAFYNNNSLRTLEFALDENNQPMSYTWSKLTIDLTQSVGYTDSYSFIVYTDYTSDNFVSDAESYERLKNTDYAATDIAYSNYNHDSAVATINSLPDVSSGTSACTIKFKGDSGSGTDAGAISSLTAEELAVASGKGWTVTLS